MTFSFYLRSSIIMLSVLFILTMAGKAQMKMQVTSDKAVIYATPNPHTDLTIDTEKGEVFEALQYREGWVVLRLFSGAERFIEAADVRYTGYELSYSVIPSQKTRFCQELDNAQQIAAEQVLTEYPGEPEEQRGYEQFLVDKLLLTVFRKYDIPATEYGLGFECAVE